jgi:hypothetical protein
MADVEEPEPADAVAAVEEEPEIAVEEEEEYVAVGGATEVKLFGKWSFDDIEVRDISLVVRVVVSSQGAATRAFLSAHTWLTPSLVANLF